MINLAKKNGMCPLCGNLGKSLKLDEDILKNCPICGTVFNEFGIILTQEMDEEILKNKISNN